MPGEAKPNAYGGLVRVNDRVVVDVAMVAEPYGGVVRLVHPKEDVDWFCKREHKLYDRMIITPFNKTTN